MTDESNEVYSFSGPYAIEAAQNALSGIPDGDINSIELRVGRGSGLLDGYSDEWEGVDVDAETATVEHGSTHEIVLMAVRDAGVPVTAGDVRERVNGVPDDQVSTALSRLYHRGLVVRRDSSGSQGNEYLPSPRAERALQEVAQPDAGGG